MLQHNKLTVLQVCPWPVLCNYITVNFIFYLITIFFILNKDSWFAHSSSGSECAPELSLLFVVIAVTWRSTSGRISSSAHLLVERGRLWCTGINFINPHMTHNCCFKLNQRSANYRLRVKNGPPGPFVRLSKQCVSPLSYLIEWYTLQALLVKWGPSRYPNCFQYDPRAK